MHKGFYYELVERHSFSLSGKQHFCFTIESHMALNNMIVSKNIFGELSLKALRASFANQCFFVRFIHFFDMLVWYKS